MFYKKRQSMKIVYFLYRNEFRPNHLRNRLFRHISTFLRHTVSFCINNLRYRMSKTYEILIKMAMFKIYGGHVQNYFILFLCIFPYLHHCHRHNRLFRRNAKTLEYKHRWNIWIHLPCTVLSDFSKKKSEKFCNRYWKFKLKFCLIRTSWQWFSSDPSVQSFSLSHTNTLEMHLLFAHL